MLTPLHTYALAAAAFITIPASFQIVTVAFACIDSVASALMVKLYL